MTERPFVRFAIHFIHLRILVSLPSNSIIKMASQPALEPPVRRRHTHTHTHPPDPMRPTNSHKHIGCAVHTVNWTMFYYRSNNGRLLRMPPPLLPLLFLVPRTSKRHVVSLVSQWAYHFISYICNTNTGISDSGVGCRVLLIHIYLVSFVFHADVKQPLFCWYAVFRCEKDAWARNEGEMRGCVKYHFVFVAAISQNCGILVAVLL